MSIQKTNVSDFAFGGKPNADPCSATSANVLRVETGWCVMNNFGAALDYAVARHWRIFPCCSDKTPLIRRGLHAASNRASDIVKWSGAWPEALIGVPTGAINNVAVLD